MIVAHIDSKIWAFLSLRPDSQESSACRSRGLGRAIRTNFLFQRSTVESSVGKINNQSNGHPDQQSDPRGQRKTHH